MTKEKLIALSDLNREDNIKYISSEAQGIAITLDSDRYAPNLCKLERAYICGRRKSEEQIEQLEKENAELKKDNEGYEKDNTLLVNQFNQTSAKLTNAKELLERLLITSCNSDVLNLLPNCSEVLRVRMEAEQFLSEMEK